MKLFLLLVFPLFVGAGPPSDRIDSLNGFLHHSGNTSEYAVFIDISMPSNEKRLFLVQLSTKKVIYSCWVAHGKGSGKNAQAVSFSDEPGSLCTSLGKYKVGKNYNGKHGNSYELIGLDKTNANAMSRAIVIHSAWYATEDFIKENNRCGNSWGCPAVSGEALKTLAPYLTEGTIVWIYK